MNVSSGEKMLWCAFLVMVGVSAVSFFNAEVGVCLFVSFVSPIVGYWIGCRVHKFFSELRKAYREYTELYLRSMELQEDE